MKNFHSDCHLGAEIKFLGVWDTVGALGIPGELFSSFDSEKYGFHDTGPCNTVRHGCHALAVDEHRNEFVPTLWTGAPAGEAKIEQVWFAGAHSDVGGGYLTRKLADIPLVWMAKKAEADGLVLDWSCLPDPAQLDPHAPMHDSRESCLRCAPPRCLDQWRRRSPTSSSVSIAGYFNRRRAIELEPRNAFLQQARQRLLCHLRHVPVR
jgi:uncharacterized protein (DUF2235 family)